MPLSPLGSETRTGSRACRTGASPGMTSVRKAWIGLTMVRPLAPSEDGSGSGDGRALLDDAAVEQVDGAVGVTRIPRVVRHHTEGGAAPVQLAQKLHDRLAALGIEVPGRLVRQQDRSEEHTSELQSLAYLVCRLLLEKKKKN